MPEATRQFTYTAGSTIDPDQNNANENELYTTINALDNDNVAGGAGIVESKLAFDTASGHTHNGIDSAAIPKALVFTVVGTSSTGTSVAPVLIATGALTISKVYINAKTAPTGQALICDINKNGTSIWNTNQANRIQIAAGATSGTEEDIDTTSLVEGDVLTLDVDQVGSTVAGADITITIKT